MKKIYFLLLALLPFATFVQPYSVLLKNVEWTIMKITWAGTDHFPPAPLTQVGKLKFLPEDNIFNSTFFNTAHGTAVFAENNAAAFYVSGVAVTLAEYGGVNAYLVNQFDQKATGFYVGYAPTDAFTFTYEEVFFGKNLTVTNPAGHKIYYSNLILPARDVTSDAGIGLSPNPANTYFSVNFPVKNAEKIALEIHDTAGKGVATHHVSAGEAVNIKHLPSGTYLVRGVVAGRPFTSKLIVQH